MKKKSPINLSLLLISDISLTASNITDFQLSDIVFDKRHDFLIEKDFAGIAVKARFSNLNYSSSKGVNRKVSATLFDVSDRIPVFSKQIKVRIPSTACSENFFISFPSSDIEYKSGHAYRLQLCDDNANILLGEQCFRTYGIRPLGDPEHWFKPILGGILHEGEAKMLKSCNIAKHENPTYHIRFELSRNLPYTLDVTPELEIRLYYPNKKCVKVKFAEPRYAYRGDSTYIVEDKIHFSGGYNGIWYAELLCMEIPVAGFCFSIDEEIEGTWTGDNLTPVEEYDYAGICRRYNENFADESSSDDSNEYYDSLKAEDFDGLLNAFIASNSDDDDDNDNNDDKDNDENDDKDENDKTNPIEELNHLTGLHSVKEKISAYDKLMRFTARRAHFGLETFQSPLHAMFLGSPGTGKTTVAKLMGAMLKKAGILSSGHVVVTERSTLIGKYYNSEAEKTLEAIEKAQGGILFIDEAHSLFQPEDSKDPGKFVIETLMTALADPEKEDWMLILAGYPDGMKRLFDLNPGFKSRIPDSNIYTFEDFSEDELMEIAECRLKKLEFTLSAEASEALRRRLAADYAQRDEKFGNARHVMNLIHTEILPAMAARVMDSPIIDSHTLSEIQPSDIPMPITKTVSNRKPVGFAFPNAS